MTKNPASEGSKQDLIQIKNHATVGSKGVYQSVDTKSLSTFCLYKDQLRTQILRAVSHNNHESFNLLSNFMIEELMCNSLVLKGGSVLLF